MRVLSSALALLCAAISPASADHLDPRLDELFEELRTGASDDAEGRVRLIRGIWADSSSDTVDVLYSRAVERANESDWDLSSALLDHVVGLSPSFVEAYVLRGVARREAGDRAGATEDFLKAIEIEPRHFPARIYLSQIAEAQGDKRAAYELLQEAIAWNPHDEYAIERARKLRGEIDGQEI